MNVLCKVCEKVKYAIDFQMDTRKDAEQKIHQINLFTKHVEVQTNAHENKQRMQQQLFWKCD